MKADCQQMLEKPIECIQELECFGLGEISYGRLDHANQILGIINTHKTLYALQMLINKSSMKKSSSYLQIPLPLSQYQRIKSINISKIVDILIITVITQNNQLKIWSHKQKLSLVFTIESVVDCIIQHQAIFILASQQSIQGTENDQSQQYALMKADLAVQRVNQQKQLADLLEIDSLPDDQIVRVGQWKVLNTFTVEGKFLPTFQNKRIIRFNNKMIIDQKKQPQQLQISQQCCLIDILDVSIDRNVIAYLTKTKHNQYIVNLYDRNQKKYLSISLSTLSNFHHQQSHINQKYPFIHAQLIPNSQMVAILIHHQQDTKLHIIKPGRSKEYDRLASISVLGLYKPKIIKSSTLCNSVIIDQQSHNIYSLGSAALKQPSNLLLTQIRLPITNPHSSWQQQRSIHHQTLKNLNARVNSLKALQSYVENYDLSSGFRFLANSMNMAVLNDGLSYIAIKIQALFKRDGQQIWVHFNSLFGLISKLYQSKYQSHIENGLNLYIMLMGMVRQMRKRNSEQQGQQVKEVINRFQGLIESKRTVKLLQQEKKIKLFELAYQLKNMVNSYGKIAQ